MYNLTLINKLNEKLVSIRKELNENAELSFQEFKTQKILSRILSEYNIDHKFIGGTGIVATIGDVSNDSKVIAVRADMDALPGEHPGADRHPDGSQGTGYSQCDSGGCSGRRSEPVR